MLPILEGAAARSHDRGHLVMGQAEAQTSFHQRFLKNFTIQLAGGKSPLMDVITSWQKGVQKRPLPPFS